MRTVTATEYKHNALKLLAEVQKTGEVVRITKRGEPCADLMPILKCVGSRKIGQFEGRCKVVADLVKPILDPEEWGDAA